MLPRWVIVAALVLWWAAVVAAQLDVCFAVKQKDQPPVTADLIAQALADAGLPFEVSVQAVVVDLNATLLGCDVGWYWSGTQCVPCVCDAPVVVAAPPGVWFEPLVV